MYLISHILLLLTYWKNWVPFDKWYVSSLFSSLLSLFRQYNLKLLDHKCFVFIKTRYFFLLVVLSLSSNKQATSKNPSIVKLYLSLISVPQIYLRSQLNRHYLMWSLYCSKIRLFKTILNETLLYYVKLINWIAITEYSFSMKEHHILSYMPGVGFNSVVK